MGCMAGSDDFDELRADRPGLSRPDAVTAQHMVSPAGLTEKDARILDDAGFIAEPERDAQTAQLIDTALTVDHVAAALRASQSQIRQARLRHGLWAIDVDGRWLFPRMQFEENPRADGGQRQIRGLDQVLEALLHDLHPASVAGFLDTPHPNLLHMGTPTAPVEWLRSGGDTDPVLDLVAAAQWTS